MRRVALVVGALVALAAQFVLVVMVTEPWVSAGNAAGGECLYSSNCIEDGWVPAVMWGWLLVPILAFGPALLVFIQRYRLRQTIGTAAERSWSADIQLSMAFIDAICWTVYLGCAARLIVTTQSILIDHLAEVYAQRKCFIDSTGCFISSTRAGDVN